MIMTKDLNENWHHRQPDRSVTSSKLLIIINLNVYISKYLHDTLSLKLKALSLIQSYHSGVFFTGI